MQEFSFEAVSAGADEDEAEENKAYLYGVGGSEEPVAPVEMKTRRDYHIDDKEDAEFPR